MHASDKTRYCMHGAFAVGHMLFALALVMAGLQYKLLTVYAATLFLHYTVHSLELFRVYLRHATYVDRIQHIGDKNYVEKVLLVGFFGDFALAFAVAAAIDQDAYCIAPSAACFVFFGHEVLLRMVCFKATVKRNGPLEVAREVPWSPYPPSTQAINPLTRPLPPALVSRPGAAFFDEWHETVNIDATCSICLDAVEANDPVYTLRCRHVFHALCLEPWMRGYGTCPMCRDPLVP